MTHLRDRGSAVRTLVVVAVFLASAVRAADGPPMTKPEAVGMSSERLARIEPAMQKYVDEGKLPGVITLVARRGKVVHFEAIGYQNVADAQPMRKDTIVRLYSQSKPITGAAVLILFEEGRFLLTDPVAKYLPEFEGVRVLTGFEDGEPQTEPARPPITIQHLLTHTAGLTYDFFPTPLGGMYREAGVVGAAPGVPYESLAEWTAALAELPLQSHPGTAWNYSVAMDVLGRLVEVVSGMTFRDFLKTRIFDPLGMVDTDFYVPPEKLDRFATNYAPTPDGKMTVQDEPSKSPYRSLPKVEMGGSGLVGTAADYFRFAQMLANGGELDGVRILGSKTVELMMSDHLGPDFPPDPLTSLFGLLRPGVRSLGYGFGLTGFVVTNAALTGLPISNGVFSWGGAATTHFWVDPQEDLVGIVLTQLLPDGTYPIRELMQVLTYQAIVE